MPHQTGEKHLERFKGAGAVGDWADALWTYVRDEDGTRYLWAEGRARIELPETALSWNAQTGQLWWGSGGTRAQTAKGRQRERIEQALRDAGDAGLMTEALKDRASGNRKAAGELIAAMVAEGVIWIETRNRTKIHRLK